VAYKLVEALSLVVFEVLLYEALDTGNQSFDILYQHVVSCDDNFLFGLGLDAYLLLGPALFRVPV
jgi:hypothetical protein